MATRPLRQYYDQVTIADDLGDFVAPWQRHRARLAAALATLNDEQWTSQSRCTDWDTRGVVCHLVTVDGFWAFTLGNARAGEPPPKLLLNFDPSTATEALVGPLMELSNRELLDRLTASTDTLMATVAAFTPDDWTQRGESPLGHLPARYLMGHAFWDSWLHERDAFLPLGQEPPREPDEVRATTGFALLFAGLQGGVLDDASPVGPGPTEPIDVNLAFDEFRDAPLHLTVDTGVRVTLGDIETAVAAGSAVDVIEAFTGREPHDAFAAVPRDLVAQMERAAQVL
jgi:uncharacterized protein (TIGR03083 family)